MKLPKIGKIESGKTICVEWSAARFAKENEDSCGDLFLVKNYRDQVLVAAVDGLGHGEEAFKASKKALETLNLFSNESLISIINTCHKELRKTRGVVMSLAVFDMWEQTMTWTGVGNVEGILYRDKENEFTGRENIIIRGGVVGYKLPFLKASMVSVSPGDTLIFATDGVNRDFLRDIDIRKTPEKIVEKISSKYIDHSDDALVLVARYTGVDL